jgi:5-methyltetrahydrofolate--homocysteine methyltransferase
MAYDLTPSSLAMHLDAFVSDLGVGIVGGCCGTTPEHIAAVVERCRPLEVAERLPVHEPAATSLYSPVPFRQDTSFLIIGERTNANGSKAFREAMLAGDLDGAVAIGREQVKESAHLVDLCVDYVGRDGVADMDALATRFATEVAAPVVLDSTEPEVLEAGLERFGGRCVLNSANLEDGHAPGSRADRVFRLAREHGAAVICLLIDEEGQARDADWKLTVAHRLHDLAVNRYGLAAGDLLFDPLTFPLTTGEEDLRQDAMETMEALRRIKAELPGVFTVLGVSNVSFGLKPAVRRALNSVFLHECLEAGLDAAIVHAGKILPLHQIDPNHRQLCLDLIYDRRRPGHDPLTELLAAFDDVSAAPAAAADRTDWPVDRRLHQRIVDGDRSGLDDDLQEALDSGSTPLGLINEVLLGGMKEVGELFAAGDMQLPFVLRSAETMKAAVAFLEPLLDQSDATGHGSIVLATVQGDVHDIGKNLVDIILTNNGFTVHNLGIKVSIGELIDAYQEVGADAIGMSGLLVKSTLVMRDNLEELNRRGLGETPVLVGGAALTRSYVENDLQSRYRGPVFYGKDAFAGLDAMRRIVAGDLTPPEPRTRVPASVRRPPVAVPSSGSSSSVARDNRVPQPPFLGTRIVKGIHLDDVAQYVNETALFRNQWQFRPESDETDVQFKQRMAPTLRGELAAARAKDLLTPQVVYGYFPANADGDDLVIWHDGERAGERLRLRFPRQQHEPGLCIADFFRPIDSPDVDYAAFHIVSMGPRVSAATAELFAADRYRDYLLLHGLGVEMAEALAEYWHRRIRLEWGFADEDGPTLHGLFRQQYRGGRYSWGYPACPDLEDNLTVAELLGAERLGISVGPETGYQYHPEQTTSALICHHPQAKYFIARKPREARG